MAWSVIREATEEDNNRLDTAARRFVERHHIDVSGFENDIYAYYIAIATETDDDAYLSKLWYACIHRALRCNYAEGIAYGKVGYSVK